jgi:hypothetical protein
MDTQTSILEFMYNGEVNVAQEDLSSFLAVAEDLKVKGLTQELGGSQAGNLGDKIKAKATLTPSTKAVAKNGGSSLSPVVQPPVKRAKQEIVRVKKETAANQVCIKDSLLKGKAQYS